MFITAVCVIFLIKLRWPKNKSLYNSNNVLYTPYSKMVADLCGYKLALVASFEIKYSFEF